MGDFQPEAQVKGCSGSRMIALHFSSKAATCWFISAMQQMYKDFASFSHTIGLHQSVTKEVLLFWSRVNNIPNTAMDMFCIFALKEEMRPSES
jgi:hypothetical protein